MTVDPRYGFWLSIILAVIGVLAAGSTQLTTIFGEHTANIVLAIAALVMGAGNAVNAILHAIPSGPNSAKDFALGPTVKPIILIAVLILGTVLMPSNARAQTASGTSVLQALLSDAQAASADAKTNNDTIAQTCYDAIAVIAQAKLGSAQLKGGALLVFQKVRDVSRLNSSPIGTSLIVGCAPLVQDSKISFVQFFTNIGAAVLLKGLVIP